MAGVRIAATGFIFLLVDGQGRIRVDYRFSSRPRS